MKCERMRSLLSQLNLIIIPTSVQPKLFPLYSATTRNTLCEFLELSRCIFNNHVCKKAAAAFKILVHCQASLKYYLVNNSPNIFYRKAFKNGIDFTKRQFSKRLICQKLISPTVHILPCSRILPHF